MTVQYKNLFQPRNFYNIQLLTLQNIMVKTMNKKTNPQLIKLIKILKKKSYENKVKIWKDIAKRLEKSSKRYAAVNVWKLEKFLKDDETAIVPGKLLGYGNINRKVNVAAFAFSKTAKQKIEKVGGKTMSIMDLVEVNPKGSGIRIIR